MRVTDLLASVPLWLLSGAAIAQPMCGGAGVSPSSIACLPTSLTPTSTDVIAGSVATGPTASNQDVRIPIYKLLTAVNGLNFVTTGSMTASGALSGGSFATVSGCYTSGSPAVCGAAPVGGVAVPTGSSPTLVVNDTLVTANSQILLTIDQSLGTKLTATCNSANTTGGSLIAVSARSPGTSFTIVSPGVVATNPVCVNYMIIN